MRRASGETGERYQGQRDGGSSLCVGLPSPSVGSEERKNGLDLQKETLGSKAHPSNAACTYGEWKLRGLVTHGAFTKAAKREGGILSDNPARQVHSAKGSENFLGTSIDVKRNVGPKSTRARSKEGAPLFTGGRSCRKPCSRARGRQRWPGSRKRGDLS